MKNFLNSIINFKHSIKEGLELLNKNPVYLTLFVVDDKMSLLGTLTDGDIRRGILNGISVDDAVEEVMYTDFKYLEEKKIDLSVIKEIKEAGIKLLPILNENKNIIRIVDLISSQTILPVDALIMAGGEGRRLRPLTENIPKPLLKVGNKPIIEYNLDRLKFFGIENISISLKYLGELIEQEFGNGSKKGISINYIYENEPLGTIGALKLVEKTDKNVLLVMNSDLLTNIDFEDFYTEFNKKNSDISIATIPYTVNIPYAVLDTDQEKVLSLKEKPNFVYQSNAGIYLIKKEFIDLIPEKEFYNATDFIELAISKGLKVTYYQILGYWLDIGNHADFQKAQEDIKHIRII